MARTGTWVGLPLLVGAVVLAGGEVAAQDRAEAPDPPTREELLRQQRRDRAAELEPPERGWLESFFYNSEQNLLLQKVAAGYRGFSLFSGGFPNGKGPALGFGYSDTGIGDAYTDFDTPNRIDVTVFGTYSTRKYRQGRARVTWNRIGGTPLALSGFGHLFAWPQRDFYGRGPDSLETDRTTYSVDGNELGVDLWVEPREGWRAGLGLYRLRPDIGPGTDEEFPTTQAVFDAAEAPGLAGGTDFRRADLWVDLDMRDDPALPRAGGRYRFRYSDYEDTVSDDFSFRRYEVDLQRYLPLMFKRRVFAFRAYGVFSDPDEGARVPFYYWPALGSARRLRGLETNRLQDRNLLLLTGEYRWQIWWPMDAALFVDVGNVARRFEDLLDEVTAAYGFGLRLHNLEQHVFRLDFAWSDEGFRTHFTVTMPFEAGGLAW